MGGVVFAAAAIDRSLPLTRSPEGFPQLAWDKDTVERLRIFKLDLLGVRGFEVIAPLALNGEARMSMTPLVWQQHPAGAHRGLLPAGKPAGQGEPAQGPAGQPGGTGHRRGHHPPGAGQVGHEVGLPGAAAAAASAAGAAFP